VNPSLPEMQRLHGEPASLRRRFASMAYELLLLLGILAALAIPLVFFSTLRNAPVSIAVMRVYVFLGLAAYFLWHWQGGRQTLAMRTWRLHIVDASGLPPRLMQLVLRYTLAWPSILLFGAGLLWALVDRDRQFLHDRLAGTRLIVVPPTTASPPPPAGT